MSQFTVMFVDDEPFMLTTITRLFRRSPYRILTAANGLSSQQAGLVLDCLADRAGQGSSRTLMLEITLADEDGVKGR